MRARWFGNNLWNKFDAAGANRSAEFCGECKLVLHLARPVAGRIADSSPQRETFRDRHGTLRCASEVAPASRHLSVKIFFSIKISARRDRSTEAQLPASISVL